MFVYVNVYSMNLNPNPNSRIRNPTTHVTQKCRAIETIMTTYSELAFIIRTMLPLRTLILVMYFVLSLPTGNDTALNPQQHDGEST